MTKHTFTQSEILANPTAFNWVYILYNSKSQEMNIGLSFNLPKQFGTLDTVEKLVYYRSFSSSFDALAHKHLLASLSIESVMHTIKQANPTLISLLSEIKKNDV